MDKASLLDIIEKIRAILKKWFNLPTPDLPDSSISYDASWKRMYTIWLLETKPPVSGANWSIYRGADLLDFAQDSLYTRDLKDKSLGIPDTRKKIISQSNFTDWQTGVPKNYNFGFTGHGSGTGKYGLLEWYLGSYEIEVTPLAIDNTKGIMHARFFVNNCSGWHSATRLPQDYQKKWEYIVKTLLFWVPNPSLAYLENLVNDKPRGEVGRLLVQKYLKEIGLSSESISYIINYIGSIPSFGGSFWQHFTWEENIKFPVVTCKLQSISYSGDNIGRELTLQFQADDLQMVTFPIVLAHGESRTVDHLIFKHPINNIGTLMHIDGMMPLHMQVNLTERDTYPDVGCSEADFCFNLLGEPTQGFSVDVDVVEQKQKPTNKIGEFHLEFTVERSEDIKLPDPDLN